MPYTTSWYLDKRIICSRIEGNVKIEEILALAGRNAQYLSQGEPPVHILVDVTAMKKFPTNVLQLKRGNEYLSDPALGWLVLVGGNAVATSFTNIITQITRTRFRGFKTLPAALQFLESEDHTLVGLAERSAEG